MFVTITLGLRGGVGDEWSIEWIKLRADSTHSTGMLCVKALRSREVEKFAKIAKIEKRLLKRHKKTRCQG